MWLKIFVVSDTQVKRWLKFCTTSPIFFDYFKLSNGSKIMTLSTLRVLDRLLGIFLSSFRSNSRISNPLLQWQCLWGRISIIFRVSAHRWSHSVALLFLVLLKETHSPDPGDVKSLKSWLFIRYCGWRLYNCIRISLRIDILEWRELITKLLAPISLTFQTIQKVSGELVLREWILLDYRVVKLVICHLVAYELNYPTCHYSNAFRNELEKKGKIDTSDFTFQKLT